MKKYYFVIIIFLTVSCSTNKNIQTNSLISQTEFLASPFGFDETIENFRNTNTPNFKLEKTLRRNKHYQEKTDTIYKFIYKKSNVFFYKTHLNKEFLLTGKILNKQIKLKNGIQIGISKDDFSNRFKDKLEWKNDSIQMIGEGTKYTFTFENNKLSKISIDNYFD